MNLYTEDQQLNKIKINFKAIYFNKKGTLNIVTY